MDISGLESVSIQISLRLEFPARCLLVFFFPPPQDDNIKLGMKLVATPRVERTNSEQILLVPYPLLVVAHMSKLT